MAPGAGARHGRDGGGSPWVLQAPHAQGAPVRACFLRGPRQAADRRVPVPARRLEGGASHSHDDASSARSSRCRGHGVGRAEPARSKRRGMPRARKLVPRHRGQHADQVRLPPRRGRCTRTTSPAELGARPCAPICGAAGRHPSCWTWVSCSNPGLARLVAELSVPAGAGGVVVDPLGRLRDQPRVGARSRGYDPHRPGYALGLAPPSTRPSAFLPCAMLPPAGGPPRHPRCSSAAATAARAPGGASQVTRRCEPDPAGDKNEAGAAPVPDPRV